MDSLPVTIVTREDIAYAAGFFDGEGNCSASNGAGPRRNSLLYRVNVGQVVIEPLEWMVRKFGGHVVLGPASLLSVNQQWRWNINGAAAYVFLKQIRPYLKVKDGNVDVMLKIWEQRADKPVLEELILERKTRFGRGVNERHTREG